MDKLCFFISFSALYEFIPIMAAMPDLFGSNAFCINSPLIFNKSEQFSIDNIPEAVKAVYSPKEWPNI